MNALKRFRRRAAKSCTITTRAKISDRYEYFHEMRRVDFLRLTDRKGPMSQDRFIRERQVRRQPGMQPLFKRRRRG